MKTFREFLEIADVQLDEGIRNPDVPRLTNSEYAKAKQMNRDINAQTEKNASTNRLKKLIRDRSGKPPESPAPGRVGNPAAATPSRGDFNPENKPPRPRVVTPYVDPIDPSTGLTDLQSRTAKIRPFGIVKPEYVPPAAPVKRKRG